MSTRPTPPAARDAAANQTALRLLVALGCCAAGVKLALALTTAGTNDTYVFWLANRLNRDFGVAWAYQHCPINYPPFLLHLVRVLDALEQATGVNMSRWLRIVQIVADAGSLYLVYRISRAAFGDRLRFAPLGLVAVAPASIFISGFHGQIDPLMMFFVVLAIFSIAVRQEAWSAGVAFGMSCNVKIWPVVLAPVFLAYLDTWGARVRLLIGAGAAILLASVPYLFVEPSLIVGRVLGYGSAPGCWGVTRVLSFRPSWALLNVAYMDAGRYVCVGAIVGAAWLMNRRARKPPLFAQCGIAANIFMALTPGFGVQYLAWLVPWLAWSRVWDALTFHLTSGVFLFLVYTFWSRGLPWSYADAAVGPWPPLAIAFELATWGLVVLFVLLALQAQYERD